MSAAHSIPRQQDGYEDGWRTAQIAFVDDGRYDHGLDSPDEATLQRRRSHRMGHVALPRHGHSTVNPTPAYFCVVSASNGTAPDPPCPEVMNDLMRLARRRGRCRGVDLLVFGLLHVVSPKVDPVGRPVSEYARETSSGWPRSGRSLKVSDRSRSRWRCVVSGSERYSGCWGTPETWRCCCSRLMRWGDPGDERRSDAQLLGNLTFFLFPWRRWCCSGVETEGKPTGTPRLLSVGDRHGRSPRREFRRRVRPCTARLPSPVRGQRGWSSRPIWARVRPSSPASRSRPGCRVRLRRVDRGARGSTTA